MVEATEAGRRRGRPSDAEIGLNGDSQGFLVFPSPAASNPPAEGEAADADGQRPVTTEPTSARRGAAGSRPLPVRTVLYLGHRADTTDPLRHVFRHATWRARRAHIDARVRSDMAASLADLEAAAESSFDAVWACRALQHLEAAQVPRALQQILRILKPGGFAVVLVPDLQAVAGLIVADRLDKAITLPSGRSVSAIDLVYGPGAPVARARGTLAYRTGFTASRVATALAEAGFERVRTRRQRLDLWAIGHRPSLASEAPPVDAPSP